MELLPSSDLQKLVSRALKHDTPAVTRGERAVSMRMSQDVAKLDVAARGLEAAPAPKHVMITYLSTGSGHRSAAEAVYGKLKQMQPTWQVDRPVDMANLSLFSRLNTFMFNKFVAWGLWPKVFKLADRFSAGGHFAWLRRKLDLLGAGKFVERVQAEQPDMIVHTNFLGSEIQSAARVDGRIPADVENVQVVTDMVGYGMFVGSHADLTLAPNLGVVKELEAKGLDASKVAITGIPINPEFARPIDKAAARVAAGFGDRSQVLLVQGNLLSDPRAYAQLMQRLAAAYPKGAAGKPIEVAVVCGNDAKLYDALQALAKQYRGKVALKPLGFLSPAQMHGVMSAADLSVTKPGAMTTSESVASGLPLVLVDVLGGSQESHNAAYFTQSGAGVTAHDVGDAIDQAVKLIGAPERLSAMHQAADRIAQPDAAARVGKVLAGLPAR